MENCMDKPVQLASESTLCKREYLVSTGGEGATVETF